MGDRDLLRAGGSRGDPDGGRGGLPAGHLGGALGLRPVGRELVASVRARTIKARVFRVFRAEASTGRGLIAREVYLLMGNVSLGSIYETLRDLRRDKLIRFVEGSCRLMELVPGAPDEIDDGRGMSLGSAAALRAFGPRRRNTRASMATSRPVPGRHIVGA